MNENIKKAKEINKFGAIPEVEIGDVVTLGEVWDGEGTAPQETYSYKLTDEEDYINYTFEIIEQKEDPLETVVKIIDIELI